MTQDPTTVVWHDHAVSTADREKLNGHRGCVLWFTGLSGSGKSTIANLVDRMLVEKNRAHTFVLDGDNVRHGLNATPEGLATRGEEYAKRFGLTFSAEDRAENIRRIGCVAELFASAGLITLTAFVSPYRADREAVRRQVNGSGDGRFFEIFVDTPIAICEQRDPKGLYKKARAGLIPNFTGISDPYEPPEKPELHLVNEGITPEAAAKQVVEFLSHNGVFLST
jgi:adenylylsulfate kinase